MSDKTIRKSQEYFLPTTRYALVQGNFWMSFCIIFSYARVYLLSKGLKSSQVGMIMAAAGLMSAVLQPIVADFADRAKVVSLRQIIASFSLIMIVLAGILLIPVLHPILIALVYAGLVAVLQIITPLVNAAGMEWINQGVPVNFGIARGTGSLLFAAISYIAGVIVSRFSTDVIPAMVVIFYILLFGAILTFRFKSVPEQNQLLQETQRMTVDADADGGMLNFFKRYHKFGLLLIGITVCFASHNILNNFMFQIVAHQGGTSTQMGTAMAIAAAIELPTMVLFSYVIVKIKSSTLLVVSGIFFTIKSFLTFMAGSMMGIYAAQFSQALGFALFVPASVYYVNHLMNEKDRVKGQAYMTVTNTVGSIVGSLLGGALIDYAGVGNMLLASTLIALAGAVIIFMGIEKSH